MSSPGLESAGVFFLESLELAGTSPLTLDSYRRHLPELEGWLSDNDKPLTVEEIESSHVRGFLLHLSRRRKHPGFQHRRKPRAGIVGRTHVLRHTFATRAIRSDVSPFVLMKLLGHANVKTTMRYVHANGFDDLVAALDKMA